MGKNKKNKNQATETEVDDAAELADTGSEAENNATLTNPEPPPDAAEQLQPPADDASNEPAANPGDPVATPATPAAAEPPPGKFKVTRGPMINGHVAGLIIRDGVCYTDDAIKAHASLEYGCTVINTETGLDAWPKEPAGK